MTRTLSRLGLVLAAGAMTALLPASPVRRGPSDRLR